MSHIILELFGEPTNGSAKRPWRHVVAEQHCSYLDRRCIKVRKSDPEISIGTCTVDYGKNPVPVMICPFRMLENRKIFTDSMHLLTLHEPGNELHVVPEVTVPGGHVDYFLVSAKDGKPKDFVGIELQTLDTTGTVWPARQRFLHSVGVPVDEQSRESTKSFGMNWKMTAKTILVQIHHKVQTFEHLNKHLVLVSQDHLLDYMKREFSFGHLNTPRVGDSMHFHAYKLKPDGNKTDGGYSLHLDNRMSTDADGISTALGLQAEAKVELKVILDDIQRKMSSATQWSPV